MVTVFDEIAVAYEINEIVIALEAADVPVALINGLHRQSIADAQLVEEFVIDELAVQQNQPAIRHTCRYERAMAIDGDSVQAFGSAVAVPNRRTDVIADNEQFFAGVKHAID